MRRSDAISINYMPTMIMIEPMRPLRTLLIPCACCTLLSEVMVSRSKKLKAQSSLEFWQEGKKGDTFTLSKYPRITMDKRKISMPIGINARPTPFTTGK